MAKCFIAKGSLNSDILHDFNLSTTFNVPLRCTCGEGVTSLCSLSGVPASQSPYRSPHRYTLFYLKDIVLHLDALLDGSYAIV